MSSKPEINASFKLFDDKKNEEEKFIRKSVEKGHSKEQAKELFNLVLNFAGYGFNKSHSVVYSIIAYKMAYLKCHFKTIFFANLLTNVIGSETKTNEYILEAKANKIEIIGAIKYEGISYKVLSGSSTSCSSTNGLGCFISNIRIGITDANFAFLGCATKEIAEHFSKYFGMLITEAKYGDLSNFEIVDQKYNI